MSTTRDREDRLCLAVLGAAAGGLEAFSTLLQEIDPGTDLSFLYLGQQDGSKASLPLDALAKRCKLPVALAESGAPLQPGRILLVPPGAGAIIRASAVVLEPKSKGDGILDRLFASAAEESGSRTIGVLLSGMGSDGIDGLRAIRSAGGIVLVQDPRSAKCPELPRRAVQSGMADRSLDPAGLGKELHSISCRLGGVLPKEGLKASLQRDDLRPVLKRLLEKTGVDFSEYKSGTLQRRIARRMALLGLSTIQSFVAQLDTQPDEIHELFEDLLIHVTRFFREPDAYEFLSKSVLPELLRRKQPGEPLRIWVPGCSTGEEVYSTAICALEALEQARKPRPVQIFATDVSERALLRAREGAYPESIRRDVSEERLRKHFVRTDGGFRVGKRLRESCIFVRHDLTRNPSFSRLDLLSCQNLLIYFEPELQQKVLQVFHFALHPGAYLVLSESESIAGFGHLFDKVAGSNRFYTRKPGESVLRVAFSTTPWKPLGAGAAAAADARATKGVEQQAADVLLSRHVPASFLVNAQLDILHFWGRSAPYLEPSPGKSEMNLLRLLREDLRSDVRLGLRQAIREGRSVIRQFGKPGSRRKPSTSIEIEPLPPQGPAGEPFFIVLLREAPAASPRPAKSNSEEVARLREDLSSTIEYSQSFVKEYESVNANLMAANEEIQSTNEELQSTNEELETAKEELQTANDELSHRNRELVQLNTDLNNLLSSSDIPLVMVDGQRRVRRVTAAAQRILNILPTDQGRPVGDLKISLLDVDLDALLRTAIADRSSLYREAQDRSHVWVAIQIRPYRTATGDVDGAVITLHDIDAVKRREMERAHRAAIVESSDDAILTKSLDGTITSWNQGAQRIFGYRAQEVVGKPITILIPEELHAEEAKILARLRAGERIDHFETKRRTKDGKLLDISLTVSPLRDPQGQVIGASKVARDITERKRIQQQMKDINVELERRVERRTLELREAVREIEGFAYTVAHDLRGPIRAMTGFSEIVVEDERAKLGAESIGRLERIVAAGKRMDAMLQDLLTYSRLSREEILLEEIDVEALLRDVLHYLEPQIAPRKSAITLQGPFPRIRGHRTTLSLIFTNLIENAVKFVPPGETPRVLLRGESRADGRVRLWVEDNGIGIDPAHHQQIFGVFQRLNDVDAYPGTGIGLAIVKRAAERMGGGVGLESEPGRGSRFYVELPAADR